MAHSDVPLIPPLVLCRPDQTDQLQLKSSRGLKSCSYNQKQTTALPGKNGNDNSRPGSHGSQNLLIFEMSERQDERSGKISTALSVMENTEQTTLSFLLCRGEPETTGRINRA